LPICEARLIEPKELTVTATAATPWRELARRTGNGVEVALLWNRAFNRVKVAVSDERLCHFVDLEIADDEAVGAFREPFADLTSRLLETVRAGDR
jgi:hypothetical protein